ncbi:transposase [Thiomonas sp. FB-Cd]|uniref:transposase n=1 Tax=Thiomonas sp. FB-Cd TaxID=1158292 RepID=UPI001E41B7E2|nr:transposase [Thiomonas sp. FB-Cd]
MLAYKAKEAGTQLHLNDTRQLKPSQRCSACWALVPKTLAERMHICPHWEHVMPRDRSSALAALIDAHAAQQISFRDTPGTGVAARPKSLSPQRGKSKSLTLQTATTADSSASGRRVHDEWAGEGMVGVF